MTIEGDSMSGKVVHVEIPFDDGGRAGGRAGSFYRDVVGWQLVPMPEMDYTIVMTGQTDPEQVARQ